MQDAWRSLSVHSQSNSTPKEGYKPQDQQLIIWLINMFQLELSDNVFLWVNWVASGVLTFETWASQPDI